MLPEIYMKTLEVKKVKDVKHQQIMILIKSWKKQKIKLKKKKQIKIRKIK